jgi:hypothetical protein
MVDDTEEDVDPTLHVSEEHERARALAAVLRDQAERLELVREAEERRLRRGRVRRAVTIALWVGAAWIWALPPAWTRVAPPGPSPLAEEARALRFQVYLQIQAIEAYRNAHSHLPDVLPEAGPPLRHVEYVRRDSRTYELHGRSRRVLVRYRSEEPARTFGEGAAGLIPPAPTAGGRP